MKSSSLVTDGNFISFTLGRDEYAVPFRKVHEILGPDGIQESEANNPCFKGFMNLRNQKVQVLDLRCHFSSKKEVRKEGGTVLVTSVGQNGIRMGLLVDAICQILHIDLTALKPAKVLDTDPRINYVVGIANIQGRNIALLDFDHWVDLVDKTENTSTA